MIFVYFTMYMGEEKVAHIMDIKMQKVEIFECPDYQSLIELLKRQAATHLMFYFSGFPRKSIENSSRNDKYLRKLFNRKR